MKKLYFLIVIAISFVTQAQIVNIPDANFKAKLLNASVNQNIASIETPNFSGDVSSYNSIDINNDGEIQVSEAEQIKYLRIDYSQITSIEGILSFTNLQYLNCTDNQLLSLNLQGLTNLSIINCRNNLINNINLQGLTNLKFLFCDYNQISTLNLQGFANLQRLICNQNQITSLDLTGTNLKYIACISNQITFLNVQGLNNLEELYCSMNQITSLGLYGLSSLKILSCNANLLTSLDVQGLSNLIQLSCQGNQLISLFIKNNNIGWFGLSFYSNSNLEFICTDEDDIGLVKGLANIYNINCEVNSYCSFVPGGIFYSIEGNTKFDFNADGCDINDINYPKLNFSITNGTITGSLIGNSSGDYSIPVQAGTHTITPYIENPTYFNISPTSFVANFPAQTSPLVQDFCVTANGVHHDVEVTIIPTSSARPGFDANYTVIYKNKGNQVENGSVTLDFNDAVLDLVSANPTFSSQATNSLVWNYTNLQPFETRTIDLVFNVNSPTETPAVNIGDQLNYTASITPLTTDEFVSDNTSTLNQTVVGSYDPNDKICIEGTTVGPDMIGQYVHYVIRFENTGTYAAENVVVKDMIDLTKFDVSTLIPLHSSHDFVTRINGNKVEFIFEGINLPFDDANNDGYVAFKIKTKSNLVVGDTFSNDANIYFDYNFPITTNAFTTTIAALKVTDFDFGTHFTLYPNPVKDVLSFQSKGNMTINSIEIYNVLGQVVLAVPNAISTVDISSLQSGNYFVKVNTDLGVSNTKFIKE